MDCMMSGAKLGRDITSSYNLVCSKFVVFYKDPWTTIGICTMHFKIKHEVSGSGKIAMNLKTILTLIKQCAVCCRFTSTAYYEIFQLLPIGVKIEV